MTVRVWVYCAVTGSFNTVSVPWVTLVESLVQVTVVAGPPVEIQVKVNRKMNSVQLYLAVKSIDFIIRSPVTI